MKLIYLLLLIPSLSFAETKVTGAELSTTTAFNFPATAPVTISSLTATGNTLFSNSASTATFNGWVDIGYVVVSNNGGTTNNIRVGCPTGLKVLGGSCTSSTDAHVHYSYPSPDLGDGTAGAVVVSDGATNAYSWSCATLGAPRANLTAYAICARIK